MRRPGPRGRLFRKYVIVLLVLVGGVLMASSLVELYFSYRETQRAIVRVERAKAVAAAARIEEFLKEVEQQVRETTRTASDDPDASQVRQGSLGFREGLGAAMAEQRELDFLRVLRNVPAVSELSHLDLSGKEQLRVSRLEPDVVGSQKDLSRDPRFLQARAGKTYWSPVYFRDDTEPYATLAVPVGKYAVEVTTAEVSLGDVVKMVSQIEAGPGGHAYVVDSADHLVAHPDARVRRSPPDLSRRAQVKSARAHRPGAAEDTDVTVVADGLTGGQVLAAHAPVGSLGWLVFVERPAADAYAPLRAPIVRSAVIFVLGLALSILASLLLARRMVAPIRALQEGAARIGAGDLGHRIEVRTGDELQALGEEFNRTTGKLQESYANLEQKVEDRTRELALANAELRETLEQQTATSEILRVIGGSPTDAQPVFAAIAESAARLCDALIGGVFRFDGSLMHVAASHQLTPAAAESYERMYPMPPSRSQISGRAVLTRAVVHVPDLLEDPEYPRDLALAGGWRSSLSVPMLRDGVPIGAINVIRGEPIPFSDKQIALLQTFADQAVIAVENVRLFTELQGRNAELTDSLARQTATGEVLRVISSSPTDVQPVFDSIVRSAVRLCDALYGTAHRFDGTLLHLTAHDNCTPEVIHALRQQFPMRPARHMISGRAVLTGAVIQVEDLLADPEYVQHVGRAGGFRAALGVPMLREGSPVGAIVVIRGEPGRFSETQIALLQTFADQAVIAVENVRLFTELEARNRDLTEALEQQTATSDVLKVISRSAFDLAPVLQTVIESAVRLCGADRGFVYRQDGELYRVVVSYGHAPDWLELVDRHPIPVNRESATGRAAIERRAVHIPDILADPEYRWAESLRGRKEMHRTILAVPMLREEAVVGVIVIRRIVVQPFSEKQIDLVRTFADQAVIAIENVRLFMELETRNQDLTEALEQQTATSEILGVISSSPTDPQPVFDAMAESALRLCNGLSGHVFRFDGTLIHIVASKNIRRQADEIEQRLFPARPSRDNGTTRAIATGAVVHIPDVREDREYRSREWADALGIRSVLSVPMLREGRVIGTITVNRAQVEPFSERQISLLQTFADQAVIAVENVRLFTELQARTQELTRSVEELRALGEVGQAVSSTLDIQSVLTSIVSHAVDLSRADAGTIYEFDDATQAFMPRANAGMTEELIEALRQSRLRVGEGAVGQAARARAAIQIADLEREPHYALPFLIQAGFRALLAVPLLREDRVIGGLVVRRKVAGEFPRPVVDLLQTFATQSVIAIQNARLFREIDEKSRALEELSRNQEQLYRLSTALQEPLSLAEQLTRVLDAARQVVGLDHLYIWTPTAGEDGFTVSAGAGLSEGDWRDLVGMTLPMGEAGALAEVYRDGEPRLFNEANPVPEAYRLRPPYSEVPALRLKAFLLSPMIARGRTVGVLSSDNRITRAPIAPHTVELLHSFAAQAAVAVENARLFQEIQEKGRELELASKHKSQFLANMSHELRTPMNAVLGYTDLILDDIFGPVPEKIREILGRSRASGQHLLGLINDVLDLSKIEAGQLALSLGEYDMGSVVHTVVSSVESLAAEKALGLKADVPPDLPVGHGDERRLTQVLLNLAGNAIKFTDRGGVTIAVRVAGDAFVVSVTDTGPGIARADQEKIFEEFQQADSSSTRAKGGTGLGLAISRRIVELHGGRLWVESVPGEGSTFHFSLPRRAGRQTERT